MPTAHHEGTKITKQHEEERWKSRCITAPIWVIMWRRCDYSLNHLIFFLPLPFFVSLSVLRAFVVFRKL